MNDVYLPKSEEPAVITAYKVHAEIIRGAQAAQQEIYRMAYGFKRMRDEKLYEALGYSKFSDYCEQETGMKQRNVYQYIEIVERLPEDFLQTSANLGKEKLYLLSTLTEEDRSFMVTTDIENTTVKELREQIKALTAEKERAQLQIKELESAPVELEDFEEYIELCTKYDDLEETSRSEREYTRELENENTELSDRIRELTEQLEAVEADNETDSEEVELLKAEIERLNILIADSECRSEAISDSSEKIYAVRMQPKEWETLMNILDERPILKRYASILKAAIILD